MFSLSYIFWDPDPIFWNLPIIHHPVAWYGLLFALGFFVGYRVVRQAAATRLQHLIPKYGDDEARQEGGHYTDRLLIYTLVGTVVGARLGHILFYNFDYFMAHPGEILKTWHGGLASHGALIGILVSVLLLGRFTRVRFPMFTFFATLDLVAMAAVIIGPFIRFGNFVNQELVGTAANLPWAVIFGRPAEGVSVVPRHPVQLYEAAAYLAIFLVLKVLYQRHTLANGAVAGLGLISVFTARFFLEYLKVSQGGLLTEDAALSTGQLLSIPAALLGFGILLFATRKRKLLEECPREGSGNG